MDKFKRIDTSIDGVCIIEPAVFGDDRGYFMETYSKAEFEELGKSANTAIQNCIGRFTKEKGCDWTAYGLLGTLDKGINVKNVDGSTIQIFDFGD